MKICLVISELNVGGAERQLVALAVGLHRRGHQVEVAVLHSGGSLINDLRAQSVRVVELGGFAKGLVRLKGVLRQSGTQVIYSFMPAASTFVTFATFGKRGIRHVWGVRASEIDLRQLSVKARLVWHVARLLSKRSNLVIANSESGRSYHVKMGYPQDRCVVVVNGVDTQRFRASDESRKIALERFDLVGRYPVIGMVARFDPIKGHADFVEMVAQLKLQIPRFGVLLVGGGDANLRDEIDQQLRRILPGEDIRVETEVVDAEYVYNALNLLVIASKSEGFPNVALEAMCCGVPVVGYDVGDLRDIVREPGEVVPQRSPNLLADAVNRALSRLDERDWAGSQDLAAQANYSLEKLVEASERELLRALGVES